MLKINDINGRTIRTSKNLRGILDYSRAHTVERVDLFGPNKQGGGTVGVSWVNGAQCLVDFASFAVMDTWVKNRAIGFRCFVDAQIKYAERV